MSMDQARPYSQSTAAHSTCPPRPQWGQRCWSLMMCCPGRGSHLAYAFSSSIHRLPFHKFSAEDSLCLWHPCPPQGFAVGLAMLMGAHHAIQAEIVSSRQVLLPALLAAVAAAPLRVAHHQRALHAPHVHLHQGNCISPQLQPRGSRACSCAAQPSSRTTSTLCTLYCSSCVKELAWDQDLYAVRQNR